MSKITPITCRFHAKDVVLTFYISYKHVLPESKTETILKVLVEKIYEKNKAVY